jgi:hypothetical protein
MVAVEKYPAKLPTPDITIVFIQTQSRNKIIPVPT